jgi:hypothetical protein
MLNDHDKRRLSLARWYAAEAIAKDATGDHAGAEEDVSTAREYLVAVKGGRVVAETADEIIANACTIEEGMCYAGA